MSTRKLRRGFSLVELLAVVLILAVLAAVAVPLYINSRRAAAARACIANIATIASAESAFSIRNGAYNTNINAAYNAANPTAGGLVGAPEGLSSAVFCPLPDPATGNQVAYTTTVAAGVLTIACANEAANQIHSSVVGTPANYSRTMAAPGAEGQP